MLHTTEYNFILTYQCKYKNAKKKIDIFIYTYTYTKLYNIVNIIFYCTSTKKKKKQLNILAANDFLTKLTTAITTRKKIHNLLHLYCYRSS